MQIKIPISIDVQANAPMRQCLTMRQGDSGIYTLAVTLTAGGVPLCVPTDATAVLNCAKPDRTYTETSGAISETGILEFELSAATLTAVGICLCEVLIITSDGQITSGMFEIKVMPTVINDDTIKSTSEYGILKELIKQCKNNAGTDNVSDIPNAHLEGYGNRAICKLDSRVKYVPEKGFYLSESDQSLVGVHINVFLDERFSDSGNKIKYRGSITEISSVDDGNGYKIYDTGEITTAVGIMSAAGYIPDGFYGSLIINGGVDGDVPVDIPESFSAHAGGVTCLAGLNGFTSGVGCEAPGFASRASGYFSISRGERAVADGYKTEANGHESNARNLATKANGYGSDASGGETEANGRFSSSAGFRTKANGDYQAVRGMYNVIDDEGIYLDIVGCGTSEARRKNAYALDKKGNVWFAGNVYSGDRKCMTECDAAELIGSFAMTDRISGISGSFKVELSYPVDADGWRLYSGDTELTNKAMAFNEAFVTAPVIAEGTLTVAFFKGETEILRANTEYTIKNSAVRCGFLKMIGGEVQ